MSRIRRATVVLVLFMLRNMETISVVLGYIFLILLFLENNDAFSIFPRP